MLFRYRFSLSSPLAKHSHQKKLMKQSSNWQSSEDNFFLAVESELEGRCLLRKGSWPFTPYRTTVSEEVEQTDFVFSHTQFFCLVMFGLGPGRAQFILMSVWSPFFYSIDTINC
jgi:hypothetical protein